MKIEINGFVLELTTDDVNLNVRISDASGKELSNNNYSQEQTSEATPVEVPTPENTEGTGETSETPAETSTETSAETATEETPEQPNESFVPTLEEFKRLLKEGKIK